MPAFLSDFSYPSVSLFDLLLKSLTECTIPGYRHFVLSIIKNTNFAFENSVFFLFGFDIPSLTYN
jgi:hypothetical protein